MKIVETLQKDKELQELKKKYKEKYNKNAPPYNYDEYNSIEDYKKDLKSKLQKQLVLR